MAGTGSERKGFSSGKTEVADSCNAKCDAISPDRIEFLARAVALVAAMAIPETEREAVLAKIAVQCRDPTV